MPARSQTPCPVRTASRPTWKTWLRGTHHGVGADHLDHYLNEYVFRHNRRFYPMAGFATLLCLGTTSPPTPIEQILSPLADGATARRPGRSTGLTTARFSIQINEADSLLAAEASLNAHPYEAIGYHWQGWTWAYGATSHDRYWRPAP